MSVTLERFCFSDHGVFGKLILPSGTELVTVERPWLDNQRSISCIPNGKYRCTPRFYHRGGYKAVEILDVPDRSHILFHRGNYVRNSRGCILVNSDHGCLNGQWSGVDSKLGFSTFMRELGDHEFILNVVNSAAHGGYRVASA